MAKILSITEVDSEKGFGWEIQCDNQTIEFLIENKQECCENWGGIITTPDPVSYYVGSDLIGIEPVYVEGRYDEGEDNTVFLNVKTSLGVLQFSVYNSHNGYYGHNVSLIVDGKKEEWRV